MITHLIPIKDFPAPPSPVLETFFSDVGIVSEVIKEVEGRDREIVEMVNTLVEMAVENLDEELIG